MERNRRQPGGHRPFRSDSGQRGFTLIETLIAVIILMVGLVAVSHLMMVAINSNSIANHGTVATSLASQRMEELMTIPFNQLVDGGGLLDALPAGGGAIGLHGTYRVEEVVEPNAVAGTRGMYVTSWQITTVETLKCIRVRSQAIGLFGGMTRADMVTFRADNAPAVAAPPAGP